MRIQHNIAAVNANRQLASNNGAIGKNLEKLSSGYKINRAGDDAAGLAISEKMRSQITGLSKAQDNANDGISLVQTAEGALTEVHSMLNRMTELATQSANGTFDNSTDRANLQEEVKSLLSEVDRIADSTNYNGIKLLDGSLGGSGSSSALTGGAITTYKGATTTTTTGGSGASINFTNKDTVSVDGTDIEVDWSGLTTAEQDTLKKNFASSTTVTATETKAAAELIEKTVNTAISKYNSEYGASVKDITVESDAAASFKITSSQKDANSDVTVAASTGAFSTILGGSAISTAAPVDTLKMAPATDLSGKFNMTIGGEDVAVTTAFASTDTSATIVTKLQTAVNTALAAYDTAKGNTAGAGNLANGKVTVSLTADGALSFSNTTGKTLAFSDQEGKEFAKNLGISSEGKASMAGGLTLQIGDTAEDFNKVTVQVGEMSSNSLGIDSINIKNQSGAATAIEKIKTAINSVSSTRGSLGAVQNRLEHTINNLGVAEENMTSAESRVRDTDMAKEMMEYTKNNILIQASQAMLAQANQLPQGVLQLLG